MGNFLKSFGLFRCDPYKVSGDLEILFISFLG